MNINERTATAPSFQPPKRKRQSIVVLMVDDQPTVIARAKEIFSGHEDIDFRSVLDPRTADDSARLIEPDVILQDLTMDGVSGIELIERYRAHTSTVDIPVVVLSSHEDAKTKAECFEAGANDYVVKLPDEVELLARVRYHGKCNLARKEKAEAFRKLAEANSNLERSIRELNESNRKLSELAHKDGLTGIPNRRRFDEHLAAEWGRSQREAEPVSVLICDVDHFKKYNDTFGHQAGDVCLQQVAKVLQAQIRRPTDLAARYGGEEFAMILPNTDAKGAMLVAEACRKQMESLAIKNPKGDTGIVTFSIGVATIIPEKGIPSPMALLESADKALYVSKAEGRNRCRHAAGPFRFQPDNGAKHKRLSA